MTPLMLVAYYAFLVGMLSGAGLFALLLSYFQRR